MNTMCESETSALSFLLIIVAPKISFRQFANSCADVSVNTDGLWDTFSSAVV